MLTHAIHIIAPPIATTAFKNEPYFVLSPPLLHPTCSPIPSFNSYHSLTTLFLISGYILIFLWKPPASSKFLYLFQI